MNTRPLSLNFKRCFSLYLSILILKSGMYLVRSGEKIFNVKPVLRPKMSTGDLYNNPFGRPKMSTGGPLVCLFGPYFFQNEYSKPLPGPKFEYWPFESIPLDIIMRVSSKARKTSDKKA